jgi:glutamate/tyrosine decarboxylase-like PLP-dependent enzyme
MEKSQIAEETLDPQDWEALRELGHRMVDDMLTYLETVRERPVWQPMPDDVIAQLNQPLPHEPQGLESTYHDYLEMVSPYAMGNIHPRFWGWVVGTGTASTALAEMLAASMNPNVGGGNHSANNIECQVLDWCKEMLVYPEEASGLLVSGGSMANLVGLTVARNTMAENDMRRDGVASSPRRMVLYASREVHDSNQKAVELLGLGSDALRYIPVDDNYRINLEALASAIAEDRAAGHQPFCVIGCAGTVNTGAFDDLEALAEICDREQLWFHVDGAFGAWAALSPQLSYLVTGMEKANSLAFDLHKWMYMPYEVGCILVQREEDHRRAFSLTPEYLEHAERGLAAGKVWFNEYGVQLSRGFRALKVWMSLKEYGVKKFARLIQQNVDQAGYLSELVDATAELERLAPTSLNIVCFRYNTGSMEEGFLNEFNQELLMRVHESGIAVPSYTTLKGKYTLRVAITNHRSRREDFDLLIREVISIGNHMIRESWQP